MSKGAMIEILGESSKAIFRIVSFSMVEPSTSQIRFRTDGGTDVESKGNVFRCLEGDLDALPPFRFSKHMGGKVTARGDLVPCTWEVEP